MEASTLSYEDVAEALESRARRRETVTYNDLADELGLRRVNNLFKGHPLEAFFQQLDAWDAIEGQPFRTALVVHKGDGRPGRGFFDSLEVCRATNITEPQEENTWQEELKNLYHYYDPSRNQTVASVRLTHAQERRLSDLAVRCQKTLAQVIEANLTWLIKHVEHECQIIKAAEEYIRNGNTFTSAQVFNMHKKYILETESEREN